MPNIRDLLRALTGEDAPLGINWKYLTSEPEPEPELGPVCDHENCGKLRHNLAACALYKDDPRFVMLEKHPVFPSLVSVIIATASKIGASPGSAAGAIAEAAFLAERGLLNLSDPWKLDASKDARLNALVKSSSWAEQAGVALVICLTAGQNDITIAAAVVSMAYLFEDGKFLEEAAIPSFEEANALLDTVFNHEE